MMKECSAVCDLMQEKTNFFNALHTSILDCLQTEDIIEEKRKKERRGEERKGEKV